MPFCDAKAHVEEYVKTQHPSFNAAFPFPGSFYTNFAEFGLARCVHPVDHPSQRGSPDSSPRSMTSAVMLNRMNAICIIWRSMQNPVAVLACVRNEAG